MSPRTIMPWAFVLILSSLRLDRSAALAQDCYYPNGTLSAGSSREAPCGAGGICCPLNWECMSNGLCYYPPDDYYGRYSCTDRTWGSCPDICTYNYTAFGGEAILQCSNGKWCCDGNRVSGNCCNEKDTTFFSLAAPKSVTSITALVPVTQPASSVHNAASSTSNAATTSIPDEATSSPASTTASQTPTAATLTHKTVTTGKNGVVSTVTEVTTVLPSGTAAGVSRGQTTSSSGTNIGMIVGLALGIPLVLVLASILVFLLWRKKRKNDKYTGLLTRPSSPPNVANYGNIPPGTHAHETAGFPIADTRDKDNRSSELYGNDTYIYSPSVSVHTGESSPPSYSPNGRSPTVVQGKSPAMTQIQEEPQELWGGYVPYRPENAQLAPERKAEGQLQSPVSPLEQA